MKKKDMTGKKFGKLAVVGFSYVDSRREAIWECLCECGNIRYVAGSLLRDGRCRSCGCLKKEIDLVPEIPHRTIDDIEHKRCSSCKKWKKLDDFHFAKGNWDKHSYECKTCKKSRREKDRGKRDVHKKERYRSDPRYKVAVILRSRIVRAIRNNQKAGSTLDILGCSIDEFLQYLQDKFTNEMSWNNHGSYWHIDHIKPCASFDLSDPEQQKICFHYTNMQPLEAIENIRKGARV